MDGVRRKAIGTRIYIGGLPLTVAESQLMELLGAFGKVLSLTLERDPFTGDSRGFAIVVMQGARATRAAIAGLNGHMLNGRRVTVAPAV
ncbi:MAG: RNA-binding protein [candidate division WOR-3 bacterium]|nr:MAG: RNA-binding protein [candidate division WOR-3 bacterium]